MWDRIEPLMPADPVRGRRWADHRRTLEAIAWKYRTCSPWRDLPDELGSFQTAHKRLIRWAVDGTWERILAAVLAAADSDDDIGWTVSVDSTVCRAHQHAAGARKKGSEPGRSRRPCARTLPRRLEHEGPSRKRQPCTASGPSRHCRPGGRRTGFRSRHGRPPCSAKRTRKTEDRPEAVLADQAYSSRAIRSHLRRRGIRAVIPQPSDQIGHRLRRGRAGGRPPAFDAEAYKQRNAVERCINWLKQWRGLAMRTDKLAIAYQAALHLAGILIWVRR